MRILGEDHPAPRRGRDHRRLLGARRPDASSGPGCAGWAGPIRRAFVVHGEAPALAAMAAILKEEGVREVIQPSHGQAFEL